MEKQREAVPEPARHGIRGIARNSGALEGGRKGQRQRMAPLRPKSTTRRCVSRAPAPQRAADPVADGQGPMRWARGRRAITRAVRSMRSACTRQETGVQRRFAIKDRSGFVIDGC
ncbi:hypothetical protein GCM10011428_57480 [Streptomyces violaceus]